MLSGEELRRYFSAPQTVSRWWHPEDGPYRRFYARQLKVLDDRLPLHDGIRALDLGTGEGRFARYLARRGCRVTALDISEEMLHLARARSRQDGVEGAIDFLCHPIEDLERLNLGTFPLVCCMELLDHLENPAEVFRTVARRMAPEGALVFSFCSADAMQGRLLSLAQRVVRHPALHLARPYRVEEVTKMVDAAGLNLEWLVGLGLINFVLRQSASRALSRLFGFVDSLEGWAVPYVRSAGLVRYCTHVVGLARRR